MLKRLSGKNANLIFSINTNVFSKAHYIKKSIAELLGTTILLPNKEISEYHASVFGIEKEEVNMLGIMNKKDRNFILKNDDDIVISSFDLSNFKNEFFVLSGGEIPYKAMVQSITKLKKRDSRDWLKLFYETSQKMEEEEKQKKIEERKRKQIEWEKKHSRISVGKKSDKTKKGKK